MKSVIHSLLLLTVATVVALEHQPTLGKKSCPSNFIRLSHRCYFFSKEKATWQDAFFQCHSMKSNLAIIKNRNQDRLIKRTLTRKTLAEPFERWLGGRFDWQKKQWKWAASGKPLSYKGFDWSVNRNENRLQWNCIVLDPNLEYRWNSRSCLEDKHFICQRKILVNSNEKRKNKLAAPRNSSRLNEIPIPIANNGLENFKSRQRIQSRHVKPNLISDRNKRKLNKKARFHNSYNHNSLDEINDEPYKGKRNKADKKINDFTSGNFQMYYTTYKEGVERNDPLHPRPIVEEYNFAKVL